MFTLTRHGTKTGEKEAVHRGRGGTVVTGNVTKLIETKKAKGPAVDQALKGKEMVLSVLDRAADDSGFLAQLAENPGEALDEYYTLTAEEKAALASGDIKKIEQWVGKLSERQATWLWCRLSQEKW